MGNFYHNLKGIRLIRYLAYYLPNFKGKKYFLMKFADSLNKEWPTCVNYKSLHGNKFELNLRIIGQKELFLFGEYEADLTWVIHHLLDVGDIVIEAGTDVGVHTVAMAKKVSSSGCVHGFDPLASAIIETTYHLSLNNLKNVILNQAALGEKEGKSTIYSFSNLPRGHSSLRDLTGNYSSASECVLTTIDKYVFNNSINKLKLIKLDIEGSEFPALKGAIESISQMHPLVVAEANYQTARAFGYKPQDIKEWFKKFSYSCFVFRRNNWINIEKADLIKHGENMLFIYNAGTQYLSKLNKER